MYFLKWRWSVTGTAHLPWHQCCPVCVYMKYLTCVAPRLFREILSVSEDNSFFTSSFQLSNSSSISSVGFSIEGCTAVFRASVMCRAFPAFPFVLILLSTLLITKGYWYFVPFLLLSQLYLLLHFLVGQYRGMMVCVGKWWCSVCAVSFEI